MGLNNSRMSDAGLIEESKAHESFAPVDPRAIGTSKSLRGFLFFLGCLRCAYTLCQIVRSWALATVIVRFVDQKSPPNWQFFHLNSVILMVIFIVMTLLLAGISFGQSYICESAVDRVIADLALVQGVDKIIQLPVQEFHIYAPQLLTQLSTNIDSVRPYFTQYLPALMATCVSIPIMIASLILIDWPSAVIAVVTIPLIPIFMILIGKLTRSLLHSKMNSLHVQYQGVTDIFRGLPTLKALRRPLSASSYLSQLAGLYADKSSQMARYVFLSSSVLEFIATFSIALVAVGIGLRLLSGHMLLIIAVMVLILIPEVYAPLRAIGSAYHASEDGQAFIDTMLNIPSHTADPFVAPHNLIHCLEIDNVSISWSGGVIAPYEASGTVLYGQIVVLSGDNASGKTTLLRAISGFIPPTSGQIRIESPQDMILLPVHSVFFNADVISNICAFTPELSWTDTQKIIDQCGLTEFVTRININQSITTLSQGQKQLISITRVFLLAWYRNSCNKKVLVLADEPTQYCDERVCEQFFRACQYLADKGIAFLIASHDNLPQQYQRIYIHSQVLDPFVNVLKESVL